MQGAFDKGALQKLDNKTGFQYGFQCTGRHPWKNAKEPCGEYPHVLQRGGSSVYFPITVSSLVIPPYSSMLSLLLDFGASEYIDQDKKIDGTSAKVTALRRKIKDNIYSITVMLVNDEEGASSAKYCLYQPEIIVETKDNAFSFAEYSEEPDFELLDEEEKSLVMQYRNKKVYGTGLGTSIGWKIDDNGYGKIYNDFFPEVEVPSMDFKLQEKYNVKDSTLSMKHMSDLDEEEKYKKIDELETLVLAYENWITEMKSEKNGIDELFHEIADKNISGCQKSAERMRNGIAILRNNSLAWDSFQLAKLYKHESSI